MEEEEKVGQNCPEKSVKQVDTVEHQVSSTVYTDTTISEIHTKCTSDTANSCSLPSISLTELINGTNQMGVIPDEAVCIEQNSKMDEELDVCNRIVTSSSERPVCESRTDENFVSKIVDTISFGTIEPKVSTSGNALISFVSPETSLTVSSENHHAEAFNSTVLPSESEKKDASEKCIEDTVLSELNAALCGIQSSNEVNISTDADQESSNPVSTSIHSSKLEVTVSCLQNELESLKANLAKSRDDYYVEVQALERALTQERFRLQQQEDLASKTIAQLKHDLSKKQQLLDTANKDRESMVVKYAVSEKAVITLRQEMETVGRKLKDANRSRDLLSERLKVVQADKEKANNLLEIKGQESSTLNRENQRLKEDLKWTQNKLKSESESKKDAEQRITELIRKVEEGRLQVEQAHKDAQTSIKNFQESQENRAVILDQQLREQQAQLILERHERADCEGVLKQLNVEIDGLKRKQQALIMENNQLSLKVQNLEKERLEGDQRVSRLKQDSDSHHQEVADLRERLTEMESLRAQLQHYEDQLATCRNEIERLRLSNIELQQDASSCREREAELLDFTQKLTEKNVRLQSEFSALEAKAQMLENEQLPMSKKLVEAESRVAALSKQLDEEQRERQEESSLLARHLAEKTHRAQQLQQQLEDCQGEVEVLKRKHAASIRELTRELQHVHKRQENIENNGSGSSGSGSTSLGQGSRASSTSSLNNACDTQVLPSIPTVVFPNGMEPDKQVLIERLVKLQRENARKAEKLDFLEEHNQTLLSELQKKSRIIQTYVMRLPAGALSSDTMDQNKAELAKRSGIMASMYGNKTDEAMTLELSMEINRKLQAVLEDTLLKNITLKENLDTLGSEIARLSHNN